MYYYSKAGNWLYVRKMGKQKYFEAGEDLKRITAHSQWVQVPHFTTLCVPAKGLHDWKVGVKILMYITLIKCHTGLLWAHLEALNLIARR